MKCPACGKPAATMVSRLKSRQSAARACMHCGTRLRPTRRWDTLIGVSPVVAAVVADRHDASLLATVAVIAGSMAIAILIAMLLIPFEKVPRDA